MRCGAVCCEILAEGRKLGSGKIILQVIFLKKPLRALEVGRDCPHIAVTLKIFACRGVRQVTADRTAMRNHHD